MKIKQGLAAIILATAACSAWATPQTAYYIYDEAGHVIGEYDANGNAIQEHIYLGDRPVAVVQGGSVGYVTTDQLNTPRAVTTASKTIEWSWTSDPFGNGQPTGSLTYNLRFPGQYYDAETGHSYNYLRDYDPSTGRYTESDPIGLNGGINEYRYAYANPVKYLDPMGTCTKLFCLGFATDKLASSKLVDPGQWQLINVHEEPEQPLLTGGLKNFTSISNLAGLENGRCFFSRTRTYQDEYTRTYTGRCVERCTDCGGNSHLQWTSYTNVENYSEERREREQQTMNVLAFVPALRCLEVLGDLH